MFVSKYNQDIRWVLVYFDMFSFNFKLVSVVTKLLQLRVFKVIESIHCDYFFIAFKLIVEFLTSIVLIGMMFV